jgi:glyoxylase-like metal-dependent hydrolase (beta-lactamase superfamily II)
MRRRPLLFPDRHLARRTFITDLGRGAFALAVVALAGCGPDVAFSTAPSGSPRPSPGGSSPSSSRPSPSELSSDAPPSSGPPGGGGDGVNWARVNLGFVSAYILVRGAEAAIVDTGVGGSADAIEQSLTGVGLTWDAVGHLILTHHHGDHVGSASEIQRRAPQSAGYAGAEDIAAIPVVRPLTAVGDGDEVFDLRIVTTPGHTAGSISVLDPVGGILVAGDAMGTAGGAPTLPGAQFTVDMDVARQSIVKVGGLAFETLLVGHGDPIEAGASAMVAALGAPG